jgi:hypothetical protein
MTRGIRSVRSWLPDRSQLRTLGVYVVAGVIYITIGLIEIDFILASIVALAYLLIAIWLVPAAFRKLR